MTAPFIVPPIFRLLDNSGLPAAGYLLYTYAAGTTTPKTTYSDANATVPNSNPVVLDSTGSAIVRAATGAYNLVAKDPTGTTTIWSADQYIFPVYTQADVGALLYPETAAEVAAGATPVSLWIAPGNVLRYGTNATPGTTDMTAAIQAALNQSGQTGGASAFAPAGTYALTAGLTQPSNSRFSGAGSATVLQFASGSVTNITMSGVSYATVRDLKISIAGSSAGGLEPAAVYMLNATHCTVENLQISGCWFAGIWLDAASNYNRIVGNSLHDFNEPAGAAGDIMLESLHGGGTVAPSYNVIDGNTCLGGGGFGIAIYDPYSASLNGFPVRNLVTNNRIGAHITYGIMLYMPGGGAGPADTWNTFANNYVENIAGTNPTNNASGAGIYCVGNGIGATQISDNTIVNCCTGTVTRSLAPAGIGISNVGSGVTPPIISNNIITNMTQGDGILITSSVGGASVLGNSVNMPSNNNGSGPGGASLQGAALRAEASSDVTFADNQARCYGANAGIYVYANGVNANHITIDSCNIQTSGAGNALQVAQNGGFTVNYFSVSNSYLVATNGTPDAVNLNAIVVGTFANNRANATTSRALFVNGCTQMRFSGGEYQTTGSVAIGTSGTCTSSFIDKTVWFGGVSSLMSNAGTGCVVEWRVTSNAIPTTGTFAVGDHTVPAAVAIGSPKGWYCTTAGSPGTHTSEGNL